jgi:hypothetical protein
MQNIIVKEIPMKKVMSVLVAGLLFGAPQAHAANGDMIVDGRFAVGTAAPISKVHVKGPTTVESMIRSECNLPSQTPDINNIGGGFVGTYSVQDGSLPRSGERIGYLVFGAMDGTTSLNTVGLIARAETLWTKSDGVYNTPTALLLETSNITGGRFERMRISGNGYVGIGTQSPQYLLDVAGQARINGTVYASDVRFKKILLPISNPLDSVLKLAGVSYEWKTDEYKEKNFPTGRHIGFIAQEVEKVLPDVVSTAADGTKSVAYTEIIPVLIEAIKEQQKRIEQLEKKLTELH